MFFMDAAVAEVVDQHVVPHVERYLNDSSPTGRPTRPFVLGLTGLQGSGKSTWAAKMVKTLRRSYHFNAIAVSLDDFYHDHAHLVAIARQDPTNKLLQTRGQPGSHEEALAVEFFASLQYTETPNGTMQNGHDVEQILIPSFDKSKFGGEGDRAATSGWQRIPKSARVDIVVFEGWCIGFQPLLPKQIYEKWEVAQKCISSTGECASPSISGVTKSTLPDHRIEHLECVNENLRRYCDSFMGPQHFDCLVHLDTDDLHNVYDWRLQQEHALRTKGHGAMSDGAVEAFVRGYMPTYELYLEQLRESFFPKRNDGAVGNGECSKGHVRVLLDRQRSITSILAVA